MYAQIPSLTPYKHIRVLRGDEIAGGLKRPPLEKILPKIVEDIINYPADGKGSAGEALALACLSVQKKLELLLPDGPTPTSDTWKRSIEFDHVSYKKIPGVYTQAGLKDANKEWARKNNSFAMPIGCQTPEFRREFANFIDEIWKHHQLANDAEVWYAGGSGTLAEVLHEVRPKTRICIGSLGYPQFELNIPVRFFNATEPSDYKLPFPVNPDYDQRLWPKVLEKASPGAIVINYAA